MTNPSISLDGIEKAVSGLNYNNRNTLKYRLVQAIKNYYTSVDALNRLQVIPPEELISNIWHTEMGTGEIRSKVKNLNSIRSSVNKDLVKGYQNGANPEGIIIGNDYIFVMSDEAKDRFIGSLSSALMSGAPASIDQIAEITRQFGEFLNKIPDNDVLKFLGTLIDSLNSNRPLPPDQIPEMLNMFGNILANIPDHELLKEQNKISELIDHLSEATGKHMTETVPNPADTEARETRLPETLEVVDILVDDTGDPDDIDIDALDEDDGMGVIEEMDEDEFEEEDVYSDLDDSEDDYEVIDADENLPDSDVEEVVDVIVDEADGVSDTEGTDAGVFEEVYEDALEEAGLEDESMDEDEFEEVPDDELGNIDVEEVVEEVLADPFDAPHDAFMDDALMRNDALSDRERKRLLAERFDRYLGEMERHYNQYILVPKGEYITGSQHARGNEHPVQKVLISGIFFGKYPVTNALFEVFVERTGYKTTAEECGHGIVFQGRFQKKKDERTGQARYVWNATSHWEKREGAFWYQPSGPGSTLHRKRNHPVVQVSLRDAMAFASWVGKRLPTEAEWEAAARTSEGNVFPWGNDWKEGLSNTEESEISDTVPVDHFSGAKNAFGISDLLGNTLEWTMDPWDPADASKNMEDHYIVKGGSWISNRDIRLYFRAKYPIDFTANILGFRCLAD